jgi:hypothetical protein
MTTDPTAAEALSDEPVEDAPDTPSPDAPASADSLDAPEAQPAPSPGDERGRRPLPRIFSRPRFWAAFVLTVALVSGWGLALNYHRSSEDHRQASEKSRAAVSDLSTRLETMTQQRDTYKARDDQIQTREDAAKQREDRVQASEDAVKKREEAVKQREDAATQTEKVQAQNTIHEGNWAVGVDIQPGTYRATAAVSGSCYWAINSDANGRNIVANDIVTGGRPTVTLSGGQYFTTQRCGDWAKVS